MVNTPAAKSEHDDDEDDVDTPVVGRSPAHLPLPRSFSDVAGLHRRNSYAGSLEDVLGAVPSSCPQHHHHLRRTLAVADWLAGVRVDDGSGSSAVDDDSLCDVAMGMDESGVSRWSSADHGFISGLMTESAELDASRLALTTATNRASSIFPASSGIAGDDDGDDGRGLNASTEQSHLLDEFQLVDGPCVRTRRMSTPCSVDETGRWRRSRRRYSLANSAATSDYEYRESLVSKGFSVDLGEDLDGMVTPPSSKPGAGVTVAGMESLHQALRQIQRDVDDMNRKFDGLRTSAAVNMEPSQTWSAADKSRVHSAVHSACDEPLEQEDEDVSSERQQSDYIWDYRSDLVPEGDGHRFIALRPVVPSSSGNFVLQRTSLPRNYSDLCTEASTGCGTDDGMGDLYIDDDFGGTDGAVCEWVPEKVETESQLSCDLLPKDLMEVTLLQDAVPTNSHSAQIYRDFNCCSCCHLPMGCGHSDSCCIAVKRHCPSHCDFSPPLMRRSSATNHPWYLHHSTHVRHARPWSSSHSACCNRRGDDHGHCCNFAGTRLSLRRGCVEELPCCNNAPRSSTPMDEMPTIDYCNNFHSHSSTSSIVGRSIAETRPVGEKQDISKVIDSTFSGCTALRQVCLGCCWLSLVEN